MKLNVFKEMSSTVKIGKKSPKLRASIVESVLESCVNGVSFCELLFQIQKTLPMTNKILKKYLFYLISYDLVSYNGNSQSYLTEDGGFDLLHMINKEKKNAIVNSDDIVITLEGIYK